MGRLRFFGHDEVDIHLRNEPARRPRRLVPWWMLASRRLQIRSGLRRQARGSLTANGRWRKAEVQIRAYARRSVVKASFSPNRKSGRTEIRRQSDEAHWLDCQKILENSRP
jgi:hypothetical protein